MRILTLVCAALLLVASAASAGVGRLDLTWTEGSGGGPEDGFAVERHSGGCTPGAAFTEIARTAANITTYADLNLAPGTTWCYRVRAFNPAGFSGYSNEAAGTTVATPATPSTLIIR